MTAANPAIAVLGAGIMGGAMARRAAEAGFHVSAWSVPIADAERLAPFGVRVASAAAAAVRDADLIVTMAPDADATESFADGPQGFLPAMSEHAVWIQCSTVGAERADGLIRMAREHNREIVDAPVLGSRGPAERGELVILASGSGPAVDRCQPFFDVIARKVLRVGPAGTGSRLKLVANQWIVAAVAAIAEALALAEAMEVDGHMLLDALSGSEMDMGYLQIKGRMMLDRDYTPQGTIAIAAKDASLACAAAKQHGLPARVSAAVAELTAVALNLRGDREDMAAAFEAARAPASALGSSASFPDRPGEPAV